MDNPELRGNRVRVIFLLEPSDMHDHATETLWSVPLGDMQFTIDNVPFFIFGVNNGNVVLAKQREERYEYVKTVNKGGHSTYRISVTKSASAQDFKVRWKQLTALGCSKESYGPYFHAVDVPPETDITPFMSCSKEVSMTTFGFLKKETVVTFLRTSLR